MKHLLIISFVAILFLVAACTGNQRAKSKTAQTEKAQDTIIYSSIDELFLRANELSKQTVHVKGIIDHVCKHSGKRFKIRTEDGSSELKIELGDNFPSCDPSIMGKTAKISGKLVPVNLDADGVRKWEAHIRENHQGEEDTEHFQEEIRQVQQILSQIESGEIPYYVQYYVEAEKYFIE